MGGGRRRGNAAGRRNDRGKKIGQGELFQRWDDGAGGDETAAEEGFEREGFGEKGGGEEGPGGPLMASPRRGPK